MPGALTYRRSGYPPVYSVYIDIELPQPQEPRVHITRFREESYIAGGGCGSCGYQTPIHVYRSVMSRTQHIAGNQVQIGRWVYQFGDIRPDDQVRIERYEAHTLQESSVYTATNTSFTLTTPYNSWANDDSLHITLIDGDQPARHTPRGQHWWQQEGVMRVRNGFAVRGLTFIPVPRTDPSQRLLVNALKNTKQVEEPISLN